MPVAVKCVAKNFSWGKVFDLNWLIGAYPIAFFILLMIIFFNSLRKLDSSQVEKDFYSSGLKIANKEQYLNQAERDLNRINSLFQIIVPAIMVIFIFLATSVISFLAVVQPSDKSVRREIMVPFKFLYKDPVPAGELFILRFQEMLIPLVILGFSVLLCLLAIMKIATLKPNLLIKALHELPDEPVGLKYSMNSTGFLKHIVVKPIIFRGFR